MQDTTPIIITTPHAEISTPAAMLPIMWDDLDLVRIVNAETGEILYLGPTKLEPEDYIAEYLWDFLHDHI